MSKNTEKQYDKIVDQCKKLFLRKMTDYGPSWVLFRLPSITDQILIKARRIQRLEELEGKSKIPEGIDV